MIPDGEREEIRQLFAAKGFTGKTLDDVVDVITSNPKQWVDTMLQEELGMVLEGACPWKAALSTLTAFIVIGFLPLFAFIYQWMFEGKLIDPFVTSSIITGIAFFTVGAVKARFVSQKWYWSGLETLSVGGCAAALAYLVGVLLGRIV